MVSNSVFPSWSGSDGLPIDFGADTDHFSAMFVNTIQKYIFIANFILTIIL